MATSETVNIKVGADTRDAEGAFRRLQDSIDKFGGATTATFFKLNQVIGGIQQGLRLIGQASELGKFNQEMQRLEQIVGRDLAKRFQDATGGTISQMDAMRAAARAMGGELGLSAKQMETVFAAADSLGDRFSKDTIAVVEDLTQALKTGRMQGLKEYGIEIDTTKTKAEQVMEALKDLREVAKDPLASNEAADSIDRVRAKMQDAADHFKNTIGAAINFIIAALGKAIQGLEDFLGTILGVKDVAGAEGALTVDRGVQRRQAFERVSGRFDLSQQQRLLAENALRMGQDPSGLLGGEAGQAFRAELQQIETSERKAGMARLEARKKELKAELEKTRIAEDNADLAKLTARMMEEKSRKTSTRTRTGRRRSSDDGLAMDFSGVGGAIGLSLAHQRQTAQNRDMDLLATASASVGGSGGGDIFSGFDDLRAIGNRVGSPEAARQANMEALDAMMAKSQAFQTAGEASIAILGNVFGKSKALVAAEAILQGGMEGARSLAAFAMGNIPGGLAHAAAATQFFAVAAKAGGGGGSSGPKPGPRSAAGGGFMGGGGGGGDSPLNITINIDGVIGNEQQVGQHVMKAIETAKRAGRVRATPGPVTFQTR